MDFTKAFGADKREVDRSERDGRPTHIVRLNRTYPITQEDLWNAITEKQQIKRWFGEVSGEFRRGARFSIEGNADGEIKICNPPHTLVLTWEFGGSTSWVTVTIRSTEDGARLTLEHELPTDEENEAHWERYGPAATGVGWEMAVLGLDGYLQSDGRSVIDAGQAWATGEAGKDLLGSWAKEWGEAHVEDGTPKRVAKETAKRTANFYIGKG